MQGVKKARKPASLSAPANANTLLKPETTIVRGDHLATLAVREWAERLPSNRDLRRYYCVG
jgi:hypothetical protein